MCSVMAQSTASNSQFWLVDISCFISEKAVSCENIQNRLVYEFEPVNCKSYLLNLQCYSKCV